MSSVDELRLAEYWLSIGCSLVPDMRYKNSKYLVITDIETYRNTRACRKFFALPEKKPGSPFEVFAFVWQHDQQQYYSIRQRTGGPSLDLLCSTYYVENSTRYLSSGFLGYYPWYWDAVSQKRIPAPPTIKKLYRDSIVLLRKDALVLTEPHGKRRYTICTGARREVAEGYCKLGGALKDVEK